LQPLRKAQMVSISVVKRKNKLRLAAVFCLSGSPKRIIKIPPQTS
jgi:hypothetical protein